jgi:ClpP class serine protease
MAYYFGGGNTLFSDITAAVQAAEMDPNIKTVDFAFNSGGGEAQPVADVGDMIAAMKKPTRALVTTAASAAYWLASQADSIVANSRASRVGSIGAVTEAYKPSESSAVSITSTNAPNKRPNPETEEGRAVIRTELDQFHDLFATAVAVGRDKSIETVNNTFGRGGMMLAEQALESGMIDAIGVKTTTTTTQTTSTGAKTMDLATLSTQHPALLSQIQSEARAEGAKTEQDRVKFHALMGQKTGATAFALEACLNGTSMSDVEATVEYATFTRNSSDLQARTEDEAAIETNAPAAADENVREAQAVNTIFDMAGVN